MNRARFDRSRLSRHPHDLVAIRIYADGVNVMTLQILDQCPYRKPKKADLRPRIGRYSLLMSDLCRLICCALIGLFRSRTALEAEILVLRHQLNVLRRKSPKRLAFSNVDWLVFTALYHLAPGILDAQAADGDPLAPRWVSGLVLPENHIRA
jgi:hypothetical protein